MSGERLVMLDHTSGSRPIIDAVLREHHVIADVVQELGHSAIVFGLVEAGVGISVLPWLALAVAGELVAGGIAARAAGGANRRTGAPARPVVVACGRVGVGAGRRLAEAYRGTGVAGFSIALTAMWVGCLRSIAEDLPDSTLRETRESARTDLMANACAVQRFSEGVALDFRFPSAEAAMSESKGAVISELGALTSVAANAQEAGGHAPNARDAVRALRPSQIREVATRVSVSRTSCLSGSANQTRSRRNSSATPPAARSPTVQPSIYTHNLGIAPLREALADYVGKLHGAYPAC